MHLQGMDTFAGEASQLSQNVFWSLIYKKIICSPQSKFLAFRVDLISEGAWCTRAKASQVVCPKM